MNATYSATVKKGEVKLCGTVHLPDGNKVFIVVPGADLKGVVVVTDDDGLPIIRTTDAIGSQIVKDIDGQTA